MRIKNCHRDPQLDEYISKGDKCLCLTEQARK